MKKQFIALALTAGLGVFRFPPSAVAQPAATTLSATSVTSSNATINGTVNPNGAVAASYFQYGLTTNYGNIGDFMALPATNSVLTLPGLVVNAFQGSVGASWTNTGSPSAKWRSIASSADGSRLAAVVGGFAFNDVGPIYTSTNAGITWTQSSAPTAQWFGIASSADGTQLAAAAYTGGIYTSTNAGVTWTATTAPVGFWASIASSADGTRLAAVLGGQGPSNAGPIYTSTNGGTTWTQTSAPLKNWQSIASSADGLRLAAAVGTSFGTGIYTSTDGGVTWTNSGAPGYSWNSIASSADGLKLAAAAPASFNRIWISTNGGFSWTQTSTLSITWQSVASSADGMRLAAVAPGVGIFTSTNGGVTWAVGGAPSSEWYSIASSADGSKLAAVVNVGAIFTSTGTVNPLAGVTTCHYRAVALNSLGTSVGDDMTFTTSAGPPTVATIAASSVTQTNARLNGTVNPNGAATSAYFQYGLTTNYGSYGVTNVLATTNITLSVSNLITNLPPLTTYHFQLVASNSLGMAAGSDLTVTTLPLPPIVTTLAASSIAASSATLNGTVNPNGAAGSAYFRYGLNTSYGNYSATNTLAATNDTLSVSNLISSLAPATTYHFQAVAGNGGGIRQGNDMTFTTSPVAPTTTTLSASGIALTNATLNGTVNPNGAATSAYFQYGLTTNYGSYSATNSLAATNTTLSVSSLISSLTSSTTYHFQLVAGNSIGTTAGADMVFTTSVQAVSFSLNGAVRLSGGAFQFSFSNLSGVNFTVLSTTNLALPLSNWTVLGGPVESPPGQYQFTDPQATNTLIRFYRVSSP